jgi:hypothetical protein
VEAVVAEDMVVAVVVNPAAEVVVWLFYLLVWQISLF